MPAPTPRRPSLRGFDHGEPIAKFSIVPMIVIVALVNMLLLLDMKPQTHAVVIDLPVAHSLPPLSTTFERPLHRVAITPAGSMSWDGQWVDLRELAARVEQTQTADIEPVITFEPHPNASYDLSLTVMNVLRNAGVAEFCLGALSQYRILYKEGDSGGSSFPIFTSIFVDQNARTFKPPSIPSAGCAGQIAHFAKR